MSKPSDILNRMKSKKNGAQSFIETMNEQVTENQFESKQEHNPIKENKTNHENEQENQTKHEHKIEQETETKHEIYTDQDTETKYEHKTESKHEHITELESEPSHEKITETIVEYKTILEKYSVKKTKEELFTRQTYLIRNDLIERFDKAAQTRRKGFKTEVMNELLEHFLNENGL